MTIPNQDATIEELPNPTVPRPGHADLAGAQSWHRATSAACSSGRARAKPPHAPPPARSPRICCVRSESRSSASCARSAASRLRAIRSPPTRVPPRRLSLLFFGFGGRRALRRARRGGDAGGGHARRRRGGDRDGGPPGLGHYASSDARLDGRLAAALMSIPAIKAVEIGLGFEAARLRGSEVHDGIAFDRSRPFGGFHRTSNRAGGIEGG